MKKCWCENENLTGYSSEYYKCEKCNTLVSKHDFQHNICDVENEDEDLYGKNYWEEVMIKEAGVKNTDELIDLYIPERATYWLNTCLKYLKLGSTVAEVGCGLGQFSYLLKQLEFQQVAFELSPQICQYIEKKLGLRMICGELCCSEEKYQAIIAMDVFEHLLEPEKFLRDCEERLEAEGILVMQMPCYDSTLTYEEMLEQKPNFNHLLVEEQHVFLYSRESIVNLLKKHGFQNVIFEPAFFGDDYDMFLLASKEPFHVNTEEEIEQYLNRVPNGRIVKAMIKLFDDKKKIEEEREAIERERGKILRDVYTLTALINERDVRINEYIKVAEERLKENEDLKRVAEERLANIEMLKGDNERYRREVDKHKKEKERLFGENKGLKQATEERFIAIERLTADNEMYRQAAEERLANIERLMADNEMYRRAAEERLAIINQLTGAEENK